MFQRLMLARWYGWLFLAGLLPVSPIWGHEPSHAETIHQETGIRGGLVVELGMVSPEFSARLGSPEAVTLQTRLADPEQVANLRDYFADQGQYGRWTVEQAAGGSLPFTDNLVNLIVDHTACEATGDGGYPRDELLRVLAPGGVLYRLPESGTGAPPEVVVKPWPEEIDQWTHFLHSASGNAVAADRQVGPAKSLQWIADPMYCRSHEIESSLPVMVSAEGRLIYILDEGPIGVTDPRFPDRWSLVARDGFSGVLLWKRPLTPWGWQAWRPQLRDADWRLLRGQRGGVPAEVQRRLVAVGDRVYVTLGFDDAPISILDAATGEVRVECAGTEGAQELLVDGDTVFARVRLAQADRAERRGQPAETRLVALDACTGEIRWDRSVGNMRARTLTAAEGAVVYQRGARLFCHEPTDGELRWQVECPPGHTVVIYEQTVLTTGRDGTQAFDLATGERLWEGPPTGRDLLVIDDLVWRIEETTGILQQRDERWPTLSRRAGARLTGLDFRSGESRRTLEIPNAMSPGHHLRCYRSKATERYIVYPKRGAEFLDLQGEASMRHDWLRGSCLFGILPCNGLMYVPPDQCFCYPGAKLNGLVATRGAESGPAADPRAAGRLTRGPAFGRTFETAAEPADWPMHRADARRSGSNRQAAVAARPVRTWEVALGGPLTQPAVVGDTVFVAAIDQHTVHALEADSGRPRWHFVAGGRVNSAPTYYNGLLLFGANDGQVYCLDAASGELVWRFLAAPHDRRLVAFDQLESAWPVHGTVLVMNSLAYVAAGRSTLIDSGAHFYALDPGTGEVVHHRHVRQPPPDLERDIGEHFAMDGSNIDILTTDGVHIFCMQEMFDAQLNWIETPWNTRYGDRYLGGDHLMATGGLLDDSGFNRNYWTYGNRWPGFYFMMMAPRSGNLLVFDQEHTWATKWFVERNIHSPLFFPETTGYLVFCDTNRTESFLVGDEDAPEPVRWLPDTLMEPYDYDGHHITNRYDNYSVEVDKGAGFTRGEPPVWQDYVPVRIQAMALTRDHLFAAGPPDVLDPDDPLAALEGREGSVLLAFDPATGELQFEKTLADVPRFDGMSAAGNRLFLVTEDGKLTVWE